MAVDGCSEMDDHHHRGPGNWGGGGPHGVPTTAAATITRNSKRKKKGNPRYRGRIQSVPRNTRALSIDPIGRSSKRHHTLLREGPSDTDISEGFEFHDYRHEKVHVHVVTRTHETQTKPQT